MPKSENQRKKLFALARVFWEKTDINHGLSCEDFIKELGKEDIRVERKTFYTDVKLLQELGFDIVRETEGLKHYYKLASRDFELAELRLLVDAIQDSKFITPKKSESIIKKLSKLTSNYEAKELRDQVAMQAAEKSQNESILYNVDALHMAITENRKITFEYYEWNIQKKLVLRENGWKSNISPWALVWDDEKYYLVAYDGNAKGVRHYRIDKMQRIGITKEPREGRSEIGDFHRNVYTKKLFSMFAGEKVKVTMEFQNRMIGIVIDRFGTDIIPVPKGEDAFTLTVEVEYSNQFLYWVLSLGDGAKIIAPDSVIEKVNQELERLNRQYQDTGC